MLKTLEWRRTECQKETGENLSPVSGTRSVRGTYIDAERVLLHQLEVVSVLISSPAETGQSLIRVRGQGLGVEG